MYVNHLQPIVYVYAVGTYHARILLISVSTMLCSSIGVFPFSLKTWMVVQ